MLPYQALFGSKWRSLWAQQRGVLVYGVTNMDFIFILNFDMSEEHGRIHEDAWCSKARAQTADYQVTRRRNWRKRKNWSELNGLSASWECHTTPLIILLFYWEILFLSSFLSALSTKTHIDTASANEVKFCNNILRFLSLLGCLWLCPAACQHEPTHVVKQST